MKHIICIGACYLDTILTVPHYPKEDEKLRATSLSRRRGGNCPNTLEVLSQLFNAGSLQPESKSKLSLIAVLPAESSTATKTIKKSLPDVDLNYCIYRETCTEAASSYIVRSEESGTRTIVNFNELPELTAVEFEGVVDRMVRDGELENDGEELWWHFEGRIPDVSLSCILLIRERFPRSKISVEVEKPGRYGLQELAVEANIIFYSKSWAKSKDYVDAEECVLTQLPMIKQPAFLCCTWGEDGAALLTSSSTKCFKSPARRFESSSIVDTVGAGDTFIAGIIFSALVAPSSYQEILTSAVNLASCKIMQEGFASLSLDVKRRVARGSSGCIVVPEL